MSDSKKFDRHARLVDRMAEAQGIDITEETQRGNILPQDLQNATFRCLGCSDVSACEAFLKASVRPAEGVPEFCRNADLFSALKIED